jgi:hypothetical protein
VAPELQVEWRIFASVSSHQQNIYSEKNETTPRKTPVVHRPWMILPGNGSEGY